MITATQDVSRGKSPHGRSESTPAEGALAVEFVCSVVFKQMDHTQAWRGILRDAARELETYHPVTPRSGPASLRRLPSHLESICATPLLGPDRERDLFRRMVAVHGMA